VSTALTTYLLVLRFRPAEAGGVTGVVDVVDVVGVSGVVDVVGLM
jgi:hypothetical protein